MWAQGMMQKRTWWKRSTPQSSSVKPARIFTGIQGEVVIGTLGLTIRKSLQRDNPYGVIGELIDLAQKAGSFDKSKLN